MDEFSMARLSLVESLQQISRNTKNLAYSNRNRKNGRSKWEFIYGIKVQRNNSFEIEVEENSRALG
jgi:hypothetical protein